MQMWYLKSKYFELYSKSVFNLDHPSNARQKAIYGKTVVQKGLIFAITPKITKINILELPRVSYKVYA